MRVEAIMIQQALGTDIASSSKGSGVSQELKTWRMLLGDVYRDRTLIGVLMMVFQREFRPNRNPSCSGI